MPIALRRAAADLREFRRLLVVAYGSDGGDFEAGDEGFAASRRRKAFRPPGWTEIVMGLDSRSLAAALWPEQVPPMSPKLRGPNPLFLGGSPHFGVSVAPPALSRKSPVEQFRDEGALQSRMGRHVRFHLEGVRRMVPEAAVVMGDVAVEQTRPITAAQMIVGDAVNDLVGRDNPAQYVDVGPTRLRLKYRADRLDALSPFAGHAMALRMATNAGSAMARLVDRSTRWVQANATPLHGGVAGTVAGLVAAGITKDPGFLGLGPGLGAYVGLDVAQTRQGGFLQRVGDRIAGREPRPKPLSDVAVDHLPLLLEASGDLTPEQADSLRTKFDEVHVGLAGQLSFLTQVEAVYGSKIDAMAGLEMPAGAMADATEVLGSSGDGTDSSLTSASQVLAYLETGDGPTLEELGEIARWTDDRLRVANAVVKSQLSDRASLYSATRTATNAAWSEQVRSAEQPLVDAARRSSPLSDAQWAELEGRAELVAKGWTPLIAETRWPPSIDVVDEATDLPGGQLKRTETDPTPLSQPPKGRDTDGGTSLI
jgi:hypothetical protein